MEKGWPEIDQPFFFGKRFWEKRFEVVPAKANFVLVDTRNRPDRRAFGARSSHGHGVRAVQRWVDTSYGDA